MRNEELARTIALETGNALRTQARPEARLTADIFRYFGGLAGELKGETIPLGEHMLSYNAAGADRRGRRDNPMECAGLAGGAENRAGPMRRQTRSCSRPPRMRRSVSY